MAYGHVPRPAGSSPAALKPRLYPLPERARSEARSAIICVPFHAEGDDQQTYIQNGGSNGLRQPEAMMSYLHDVFNAELETGITYPQRGPLTQKEFNDYFGGYDLIVAFFLNHSQLPEGVIPPTGADAKLLTSLDIASLDYNTELAGAYYIKPNYPGRGSHNCNAGFLVPPQARGLGLGGILGQSYLHYGPLAGYRASVFNLVYVSNVASVRIWDRLGFEKIGIVPEAGLLKRPDGQGEHYVDAWVVYKKF